MSISVYKEELDTADMPCEHVITKTPKYTHGQSVPEGTRETQLTNLKLLNKPGRRHLGPKSRILFYRRLKVAIQEGDAFTCEQFGGGVRLKGEANYELNLKRTMNECYFRQRGTCPRTCNSEAFDKQYPLDNSDNEKIQNQQALNGIGKPVSI